MKINVKRDYEHPVWEWRWQVDYQGQRFAGRAGSHEMAWTYVGSAILYLVNRGRRTTLALGGGLRWEDR